MTSTRFETITQRYAKMRIGLVGDFCLDRYLEIDPARQETSLETGLPVHNVVNVRAQPGGAGTILNNLVAIGVGEIRPVGFCGEDGEGFELRRALAAKQGVRLDDFFTTADRRTFTYCKPLLMHSGKSPVELNRVDSKNWSPTPPPLQEQLAQAAARLADEVDAFILLDQVDVPETGVITARVLQAISSVATENPKLLILADSRRGLRGFANVTFKMNRAELALLAGENAELDVHAAKRLALDLARRQSRDVFVTLAEHGLLGASPEGVCEHIPAYPVHGPIDIVGAGDAVTANLAAARAAGASIAEALQLANAAASIVIHQLGTTGTASVRQIKNLLAPL